MSAIVHRRMVGDTRTALCAIVANQAGPVDLTGLTVKYLVVTEDANATSVVAETTTGVSSQSTQTFTASATTDRLTCNEHGVREGDQVVVSTAGTLPGGLAASTRYFARDVDQNSFKLSETANGPRVDVTSAGSGTHSFYVVGGVKVTLASAATSTAGRYRLWITVYNGSNKDGYPNNQDGITLLVQPYGA